LRALIKGYLKGGEDAGSDEDDGNEEVPTDLHLVFRVEEVFVLLLTESHPSDLFLVDSFQVFGVEERHVCRENILCDV
jgi:hypothetical protein